MRDCQSAVVIGRLTVVKLKAISGWLHNPVHRKIEAHCSFVGHKDTAARPRFPAVRVLQPQRLPFPLSHGFSLTTCPLRCCGGSGSLDLAAKTLAPPRLEKDNVPLCFDASAYSYLRP